MKAAVLIFIGGHQTVVTNPTAATHCHFAGRLGAATVSRPHSPLLLAQHFMVCYRAVRLGLAPEPLSALYTGCFVMAEAAASARSRRGVSLFNTPWRGAVLAALAPHGGGYSTSNRSICVIPKAGPRNLVRCGALRAVQGCPGGGVDALQLPPFFVR